jgi:hypothetical protein
MSNQLFAMTLLEPTSILTTGACFAEAVCRSNLASSNLPMRGYNAKTGRRIIECTGKFGCGG